jgi:hypothetical protein
MNIEESMIQQGEAAPEPDAAQVRAVPSTSHVPCYRYRLDRWIGKRHWRTQWRLKECKLVFGSAGYQAPPR